MAEILAILALLLSTANFFALIMLFLKLARGDYNNGNGR